MAAETANLDSSAAFVPWAFCCSGAANLRRALTALRAGEYRFVRHEKEFVARFDYMHLNPVRKGLVSKPGEWRWSSYNNFTLDKETLRRCPIRIDYVRLPEGHRG